MKVKITQWICAWIATILTNLTYSDRLSRIVDHLLIIQEKE